MLSQIRGAQSDIEAMLARLDRSENGELAGRGEAQLMLLSKCERALTGGGAMPGQVSRSDIAAAITLASALGQQARNSSEARAVMELAAARTLARATMADLNRDLFERRVLDPYLQFASAEDEAAYRQREETNRRAIDAALAENTPEGDLRASRFIDRQLQDAGAHGADASPNYRSLVERNTRTTEQLQRAIDEDRRTPETPSAPRQAGAATPAPASDDQLASVLAAFRVAGVRGGVPADNSAHGLAADATAPGPSPGVRL